MHFRQILVTGLVVLLINTAGASEDQQGFKVPFSMGLGKNLFQQNCAGCHGKWGKGTVVGPPLMDRIYLAWHHPDDSYYQAALSGARAHHWKFGDMPPLPGMDRKKLDRIIPYIRWLQEQSGIRR